MTSTTLNSRALVFVGIAAAAAALAPLRAVAANAGNGPKAQIFAKFDTNKNGVIDGDEITAVRAAFAAEPKGQFARYDTNQNGKLDDAEIAEIKPPGAGGKKGEKADDKGGGKKKTEKSDEKKSDE
jgi:hypothetical protein